MSKISIEQLIANIKASINGVTAHDCICEYLSKNNRIAVEVVLNGVSFEVYCNDSGVDEYSIDMQDVSRDVFCTALHEAALLDGSARAVIIDTKSVRKFSEPATGLTQAQMFENTIVNLASALGITEILRRDAKRGNRIYCIDKEAAVHEFYSATGAIFLLSEMFKGK